MKFAKGRLMTLIRFMEKLPASAEKHFDMASYFSHRRRGKAHAHGIKQNTVITKTHMTRCGTTACALGWAATIPEFRKAGLKLTKGEGVDLKGYDALSADDVAIKFFKLERWEQQQELFGANIWIKSPKQWAEHARDLVKEWSA